MNAMMQRHGLTALIGALAVVFLGVIGVETKWGTSLRPAPVAVVSQAPANSDTSLLPAFALPAVDAGFKDTAERPLFLPARRPVPVASGAAQPVMKKGQFKLAGTILNNEVPYVFLVEISSGKSMRVAKGAEIISTGISVSVVDAVRVVLKQGDETEELTLRTSASPPAPPAAIAAALQRPPPSGVVVGAIPTAPAVAPVPQMPQPGMSVLPGWVQAPPGAPAAAPQANPADAAANQRRRRFPGVSPTQ